MARRWLPVSELQVGMYAAKLDLSWARSPFIRQSLPIEQVLQIKRLVRAGVQTVEIDPDRGIAAHPVEDSYHLPSETDPRSDHVPALTPKHINPLAQLNEEHAQVQLAKKQLDEAVQSIFRPLQKPAPSSRNKLPKPCKRSPSSPGHCRTPPCSWRSA